VEAVSIGLVMGAGHGGSSDNNEDKEVQGRGRSAEGRPGWRGGGEFEHIKILGSIFKKAWGWWRAHGWEQRCPALTGQRGRRLGTAGKRREGETRPRQYVKGLEARLLARYEVRRCSVGSGGIHQVHARQVFDGCTSIRARSRQNERSCKLAMAC
jgi:hypothetical protein